MSELIKDFNYNEFNDTVKQDDIKELYNNESNKNKYKEVPDGEYIVAITNMEVGYTKSTNKQVLKMTFKVTDEESEYLGSCFFMNQMLTSSYGIKIAKDFIKSLGTSKEVSYGSFEQFQELISEIKKETDPENMEFGIKYQTNDKGFKTFQITDIYDMV